MGCRVAKQLEWVSGKCYRAGSLAAAWPWSFVVSLLCVYLVPISSVALNLEGVVLRFAFSWAMLLVVEFSPDGLAFQL